MTLLAEDIFLLLLQQEKNHNILINIQNNSILCKLAAETISMYSFMCRKSGY